MRKTNGFRMKTVHGIGLMMVVHCPSWAGVATDGSLYDSTGKYIDMTIDGRKYATEELYNQLQEGMTYDQVISILGKEHEIT